MAGADEVARAHQRGQETLVHRALAVILRLLGLMRPDALARSWTGGIDARVLAAVIAAQRESAEQGAAYVAQVLVASGVESQLAGEVAAEALAGVASDGRPLDSLLGLPVAQAVADIAQGMPAAEAFDRMIRRMMMIVGTQVADAGRVATGVAQAADRVVIGYERVVTAGACSRCIILAGNLYPWSDGFERHPNCQCTHRPVASIEEWRDRDPSNFPSRIFDGLSRAEQDRIFGSAAAQAIRDGADINQIVNARRGLSTAAGPGGRRIPTTTEGTTARGLAGRALGGLERRPGERIRRSRVPRIMPEEIYRIAAGDRDEAIRLLRRFGYIV